MCEECGRLHVTRDEAATVHTVLLCGLPSTGCAIPTSDTSAADTWRLAAAAAAAAAAAVFHTKLQNHKAQHRAHLAVTDRSP